MLIFDKFPGRERAEAFARSVTQTRGLAATVHDSEAEACEIALFPFELIPPIVLVGRCKIEDFDTAVKAEDVFVESVKEFGGTYAGT